MSGGLCPPEISSQSAESFAPEDEGVMCACVPCAGCAWLLNGTSGKRAGSCQPWACTCASGGGLRHCDQHCDGEGKFAKSTHPACKEMCMMWCEGEVCGNSPVELCCAKQWQPWCGICGGVMIVGARNVVLLQEVQPAAHMSLHRCKRATQQQIQRIN